MITALIAYLIAGVLVLAAALTRHLWTRQPRSELADAVRDALYPERRLWHQRLLNAVIVPGLTGLLVVLLWPAALVVWRRAVREGAELREVPPPREFAVSTEDLREPLSLAEAEARERVPDPLKAVPDLPFGHLHPAWQALRAEWQEGDALWSFSTVWEDDLGRREQREGYVIVRAEQPGRFMLTTRKSLEENSR